MKYMTKKYISIGLIFIMIFALASCGAKEPSGSELKMDTYVGPVEAYAEYLAQGTNNKGVATAKMLVDYLTKVTKGVCSEEINVLGNDIIKSDYYLVALTSHFENQDKAKNLKIIKKEPISQKELDENSQLIQEKFAQLSEKLAQMEKEAQSNENFYKEKGKALNLTAKQTQKVMSEMRVLLDKVANIQFTQGYNLTITCTLVENELSDEFTMVVYEINGYWTESTVYDLIAHIIEAGIDTESKDKN